MDIDLTEDERRLLAADDRAVGRVGLWIAAILGFLGAALLILAWQACFWLVKGIWPPLPIRAVFVWLGVPVPETSWVGLQEIIEWCASCPVAGLLFGSAVTAVFLFTRNDGKPEPEALKNARVKRAKQRREDLVSG